MKVKNDNIDEIRDRIEDIEVVEGKYTEKKKRPSKPTEYEWVFVDRVDFAIKKKLKKKTKTLVFLFSKKLFYIYTEPNEEFEYLTEENIKSFFTGYTAGIKEDFDVIRLMNGTVISSPDLSNIEIVKTIWSMYCIANDKEYVNANDCTREPEPIIYELMLKEFLNCKAYERYYGTDILNKFISVYKKSEKFLRIMRSAFEDEHDYDREYRLRYRYDPTTLVTYAEYLKSMYTFFGYQNIEKLKDYPIFLNSLSRCFDEDALNVMRDFNIDPSHFLDYYINTYSYQVRNAELNTYKDTLKLQRDVGVEKINKYPKNINILHDTLARSINERKQYSADNNEFMEAMNDLEIDYTYRKGDYAIILPKKPQDLIDEGRELSHCVAEYISKVANRDCVVVFLRKVKSISQSFFTVEISGETITQIEGFQRNINISQSMYEFVEAFAKAKHLKIDCIYNVLPETEEEKKAKEEKKKKEGEKEMACVA